MEEENTKEAKDHAEREQVKSIEDVKKSISFIK